MGISLGNKLKPRYVIPATIIQWEPRGEEEQHSGQIRFKMGTGGGNALGSRRSCSRAIGRVYYCAFTGAFTVALPLSREGARDSQGGAGVLWDPLEPLELATRGCY